MVTGRAIPKNSTCLRAGDYIPYLRAAFSAAPAPENAAEAVFGPLLPGRSLAATATGRHALWAFLQMAPLQEGDEVLVAAYNFYVVVRLLVQRGLVPVFVDVEPETLCMDARDLACRIGPRSRMVLVTHIYGHPANLTAIGEICRQRNLLLFEDCAHAVGTLHKDRQVGQDSDGALFSFGVEKLINSFGGGLLAIRPEWKNGSPIPQPRVECRRSLLDPLTRFIYTAAVSPTLYRTVTWPGGRILESISPRTQKRVREFFEPSKDDPAYSFDVADRPPFKPFMAEMQARQMRRLDQHVARRREIVMRMRARLEKIEEVRLPAMDCHGRANASYFTIMAPDPYGLVEHLRRRGVGAHPQEFLDCSQLDQFRAYRADCPVARSASGSVVRLPSYRSLTDSDCDRIVESVASYFTQGER